METAPQDELSKTPRCVRSQLGDLTLILTGRTLAVRHKDGRLAGRFGPEEVLELMAVLQQLGINNPRSGEYFYTRKTGIRVTSHHTSIDGIDSFIVGFDDHGVHVESYLPYREIVTIQDCLLDEYGEERYHQALSSYRGFDVLGRIKKVSQTDGAKYGSP